MATTITATPQGVEDYQRLFMNLCLAKTLRVRRINDFEANLRGALFVMIIRCLCAFDICFDGLSPSFVPEKNSSWRTSPFGNNCWLCTPSDLVLD